MAPTSEQRWLQEGSRIDSEPNFRKRRSANVKNRNFSPTESLQPSIFQTQPNRKEKRTVPLCSAVTFFRLSKVLSFRAAVRHWNVHTACHWPGPASGAFIKWVPFLFLFLAFLSSMLLRRHGKSIFTNCMPYLSFSFSFSCPLLCFAFLPFPFLGFPFQYAFWKAWKKHIHKLHSHLPISISFSFPLCFLDCQENAYSQIAYLTCPSFSFSWPSFPICFFEGLENVYSQVAFLPLAFPFLLIPFLCFPFLSFP